MAKLSQTDFGTLLDLASRADVEQIEDLRHFLSAAPKSRDLILKMARKTIVARSIKNQELIKSEADIPASVQKPSQGPARTIKKARPLEIILPHGCKMNDDINFTLDRFEKYLKDQGMKSAKQYRDGVRLLLTSVGLKDAKAMTGFALTTIKDKISGATVAESNKRGQLKKFNEYLIFEYTQNQA